MKKYDSICTGRVKPHGDLASLEAAAPDFKKWLKDGMPDPLPELMIVAYMKNNKASRRAAVDGMTAFRNKQRAAGLA